jgi:hypothetical protein
MGLGSRIRDPGSGKKSIPDPGSGPGVKKAPDPGFGTATLLNLKDASKCLGRFSIV